MSFPENAQNLLGPQMFAIKEAMDEAGFGAMQNPAYAATVTLTVADPINVVVFQTLTGNITVANPVGARLGMRLIMAFTQDGTGSRTITWGAAFKAAANGAGTAGQKAATEFVYDGTNWVQSSGAIVFK